MIRYSEVRRADSGFAENEKKRRERKSKWQDRTKKPVPKQRSFWKRCVKYRSLILMSLPGLIAVFIFSYIPMYGILIAFQDYNPVEGMFWTQTTG